MNAEQFKETGAYLRARGFDSSTGDRTGGIIDPKQVQIDSGAVLFRLFHLNGKEFGEWWSTAHELAKIFGHFGRDGLAAASGRASGKGILHAALTVRQDWSVVKKSDPEAKPSPNHLGRFICAYPTTSITAYYGSGDDAPSDNKKNVQKAAMILTEGGAQVRARQLFLPNCWLYKDIFTVLDRGATDTGLIASVNKYNKVRLAFE